MEAVSRYTLPGLKPILPVQSSRSRPSTDVMYEQILCHNYPSNTHRDIIRNTPSDGSCRNRISSKNQSARGAASRPPPEVPASGKLQIRTSIGDGHVGNDSGLSDSVQPRFTTGHLHQRDETSRHQETIIRPTVGSWSLTLLLISLPQLLTWTCSTSVPRFAIAVDTNTWS